MKILLLGLFLSTSAVAHIPKHCQVESSRLKRQLSEINKKLQKQKQQHEREKRELDAKLRRLPFDISRQLKRR